MPDTVSQRFQKELAACAGQVADLLLSGSYLERFQPADLREAVTLYVRAGGKRLRPAILLWSCGAVGGDPDRALPAAATVEIFHTWTLVHDDIIDRDDRRRGNPTVHEYFRRRALEQHPGDSDEKARHYGESVAILAGDIQHGWGISMMTELTQVHGVPPEVTFFLIEQLDNDVLNLLVEGEVLDVQFMYEPLGSLSLEAIEDMLMKKTGELYRYCAMAGSMIGLGTIDLDHPQVKALVEFSSNCGVAFQLQDDLLGVLGDPGTMGKPVGSDIREGKRTTLVHYAYHEASADERAIIERTLGVADASEEDIRRVVEIFERRGAVQRTRERARHYIDRALPHLDVLPDTRYRDLLADWARFMIQRVD